MGSLLIGTEEPRGKEALVLREEPGRWKAAAASSGLWAGWELVGFVLSGLTGQWLRHQGHPSVSPCQQNASFTPGREEARAQGPAVPSGGGSCEGPGMSRTLHRAVPRAPRSQHCAETRCGSEQEASGGFRVGRRESGGREHRLGPQADSVSVPEGL